MPCDADVDPRTGRHLAVHHQALLIELVEVIPGGPMRHQVGVGDQHARRVGMRLEDADRLAGLDEQGLVGFELAQRADDAVKAFPVARGAADAAIDDQFARLFGDHRVEIVHQHAQRRLGQPGLGAELGAVRRADHAGIVDAGMGGHANPPRIVCCRCPIAGRFQNFRQLRLDRRGIVGVVGRRPVSGVALASRLAHVAAAGEFHLQRMNAFAGPAVMARDPAALEAAIDDMAAARLCHQAGDTRS